VAETKWDNHPLTTQEQGIKLIIVKKALKVFRIFLLCVAGLVAAAAIALLIVSPGKTEPFVGADGKAIARSVAEIASLEIGGVQQKMIIRGKSEENPVVLFLHGGPGAPEYPFSKELRTLIEEDYTVCWWEQRGAGMSYSSDIDPETMTLAQMVSDTAEVTNYLRERFGQEKILLIGHSWGTFLGMHAIRDYPQLYSAYIGVGQVVHQAESERLAYEFMLEQARAAGDAKFEKELMKFADYGPLERALDDEYQFGVRSSGLNKLGIGAMHNDTNPMPGMILTVLACREYSFKDKLWWTGIYGNMAEERLWPAIPAVDLAREIPSVDVPVFIVQGKYDYQTSTVLAKEYFDVLDAPHKRYFVFENSAHSPLLEEPEQFARIINDIMQFQ
jgi:pimeloyl-ACP methyl ester carboxylesterase